MIARLTPVSRWPPSRASSTWSRRETPCASPSPAILEDERLDGHVSGFLEANVKDLRPMLWLIQAGVLAHSSLAVPTLPGCFCPDGGSRKGASRSGWRSEPAEAESRGNC